MQFEVGEVVNLLCMSMIRLLWLGGAGGLRSVREVCIGPLPSFLTPKSDINNCHSCKFAAYVLYGGKC